MNRKWTYSLAALAIGALLLASGCTKLRARDQLNKGVQAFKNAKYADAVERFKEAVELDPTFPVARLYLATAYMSQYVPGVNSPENIAMAKEAKKNFLLVLDQKPGDQLAIASMASLNFNEAQAINDLDKKVKQLEEAQEWYKKLAQADPKSKEAFYSLGVIAWTKAYAAIGQAKNKIGMKPEEYPIKNKDVREQLKAGYGGVITDGITNLEAALAIDPNYDDAMAYLNLLYRQRADIADTPEEAKRQTASADGWLQKTLETRRNRSAGAATTAAEPAK